MRVIKIFETESIKTKVLYLMGQDANTH